MSGRKRQLKKDTAQVSISAEDLETIVSKVSNELKLCIEAKDIGAANRASIFLSKLHEEFELPLTDDLKQNFAEARKLMNEWKQGLKPNDMADFLSPAENKWFSIKIIQLKRDLAEIQVHYQGWDSKFDQTFSFDDDLVLLPSFSVIVKHKKKKEIAQTLINNVAVTAETQAIVKTEEITDDIEVTGRGRTVKKVVDLFAATIGKKSSKEKKPKVEKDHNDWFCTNCGMLEAIHGSDLVLCDGLCRRSFHLECLSKAELKNYNEQMASGEDDSKYFCEQCRKSNHNCFICGNLGKDYLDVVRCSQAYCGKYYHMNCITAADPTFLRPTMSKPSKKMFEGDEVVAFIHNHGHLIDAAQQTSGDNAPQSVVGESFPASSMSILPDRKRLEITNYVTFRCPRHVCDTCFEFHGAVDTSDLCHCQYCPRAFHSNCIPPASRYNSVCMVCPLHPTALLPGDASLLALKNSHSKNSAREKDSVSQHIVSFFEQLIIPDTFPEVNNMLDNHYRLPLFVKNEVESIPPTFTIISRNNWDLFPPERIPPLIIPDSGCDCRHHCGTSCFNYLTRVECCSMKCRDKENPTLCHVGNKNCGNRALQNKEYVKTKVFQEGSMGLGLKVDEDVPAGKLVIEYLGEIIDEEEMIRRMENQRILTPSDKEYYIMELYDGVYVDGKHQGNVSRYINHSCNPNCELQRWNVQGKIRIAIVAIKNIAVGEPLSYDYQFDTQQADVFKCYCGSYNCRGTMAPKKDRKAQMEKLLLSRGRLLQQSATIPHNASMDTLSSGLAGAGERSELTSDTGALENSSNKNVAATASWTLMSAARMDTAEERELRLQLVREAKDKERNRSMVERREEELTRSYVGKFQPGDALTEVKQGPTKAAFHFARQEKLFLVRNLQPSRAKLSKGYVRHLFLSRKEHLENCVAPSLKNSKQRRNDSQCKEKKVRNKRARSKKEEEDDKEDDEEEQARGQKRFAAGISESM